MAEGYINLALDRLATTFAKSATLQALMGVGTEAAAKAKIGRVGGSDFARPRLLLNYGLQLRRFRATSSGARVRGDLLAKLEYDIPAAYIPGTGAVDWDGATNHHLDQVGKILDEMQVLTALDAFVDGCLDYDWSQPDGYTFEVDEETDYVIGDFVFWIGGSD